MSQGLYSFGPDGVNFRDKVTIAKVGQFVTQFLHQGDAQDAYLAHESILQYIKLNQHEADGKKGSDHKSPTHEIGEKISTAIRNMPSRITPQQVVARLSTLCGYFELTPYLNDPEFAAVKDAFTKAFAEVWDNTSSPSVPDYPKEVKCTIPYYFSMCYAGSGMPSASLGTAYVPETRVFPGLILGNEALRKKLDCAHLEAGEMMHIEKLAFISEILQFANEDFFKATEMLSFAASVLGYAVFSGHLDLFTKDTNDEGSGEATMCRAFEFIEETLAEGSSVATEVIFSFWAGARGAARQVLSAADGNKASGLPIKPEAMMPTLEALASFFDIFSLTNLSAQNIKKHVCEHASSFFQDFDSLFSLFDKTLASCYQFAGPSAEPSQLNLYTFNKVAFCYLAFCFQRLSIVFATASPDNLESQISTTLDTMLTTHNFVPSYDEFRKEFSSVEGSDDTFLNSTTTSVAHSFAIACSTFGKAVSCLFHTGDSITSLTLLWNLYFTHSEVLCTSELSAILDKYLRKMHLTEESSFTSSLGLLAISLSAHVNDAGDYELLKGVYDAMRTKSEDSKRIYLGYVLKKLQACRNLPKAYIARLREEIKPLESISTPHCKVIYALLSMFDRSPIADDQINLMVPTDCDIVKTLVSVREKYNDSSSISYHIEKVLSSLVGKDLDALALILFKKEHLNELTVPEVQLQKKAVVDKKEKLSKKTNPEDSDESSSDSDDEQDTAKKPRELAERLKALEENEIDYYFRRTDITHLSALLEILYISIHHSDGISDHLTINVLVPLIFCLIKLIFSQYTALAEALDVSYKWEDLTRFSLNKDETYTSGERRLAVILGWIVCIVDRLGEIYDYSTILWSILKKNAEKLVHMVYNVFIKTPVASFVPVPLAIVVSYLLTVLNSVSAEQVADDLLYLMAYNLSLTGVKVLDTLSDKQDSFDKQDILSSKNANSVFKKVTKFLATQLAPLKEKAQEYTITSYAVIAMDITSDITDPKRKKSQEILQKVKMVFNIISSLISLKEAPVFKFSDKKADVPLTPPSEADPLERNYFPPGVVSDRFYIALLELVIDAYREECEVMDAIYSVAIKLFPTTVSDFSRSSKYQMTYILGIIAIIVHETGAFPQGPFYKEENLFSLLEYALKLDNYFTDSTEAHILSNAMQIICNYLIRYETYEYRALSDFVQIMKIIRDYSIPEDTPLEVFQSVCNLKEVSCATLVALSDNKTFGRKHGMRPTDEEMRKTLESMTALPWKNTIAAEIASKLLEGMVDEGVYSSRKNSDLFELVTSVIEYLEDVLEGSDYEGDDDSDDN